MTTSKISGRRGSIQPPLGIKQRNGGGPLGYFPTHMSREVILHSDFVQHLDTTKSWLETEGFQHSCNPVIQLTDLEATEVIQCVKSWGAIALQSQIQSSTITSIPDFKDWHLYTEQL